MRSRRVTICLLASALLVPPRAARAAPPDDSGPVAVGQMTEKAAESERLFAAERWGEAALALQPVAAGETGDDAGRRQLAQYHLAVALYRLQLYQASYGIFSEIAEKPRHLKFHETLLWLSRLATQLPEPADVIERVSKYTPEQIARFDNPEQRGLYWHLNYLLGRYRYRNRSYEEALRLFEKVDRKSRYYVESQFFSGISYVQLRKSSPAIQAFQRIVQAPEGGSGAPDEARMQNLALLSIARAYYSTSIRLDDNRRPSIDGKTLSSAIDSWNRIDITSEYWLGALFEEAWAYFLAGDYPRALGNLQTVEAPYFAGTFYPEADILKANILLSLCQYDEATTTVVRMQKKYEPIQKELAMAMDRLKGDGHEQRFFQLLRDVRGGTAGLSPGARGVVERALSDRQILRYLEYVRVLDEEQAHLRRAPASFRSSPLGGDVADALALARDLAIRNAGALARERCQRALDELDQHLRDASRILAARGERDRQASSGKPSMGDSMIYAVGPDNEHVLWPFDGEYWRDELGSYRQVISSKCGK